MAWSAQAEALEALAREPATRLKVLAIDEDRMALGRLASLLHALPDVDLAATVHDAPSAMAEVEYHRPDIVLLETEMKGMDGFELIARLARTNQPPLIIVVTSSDRHALRAFEAQAIDYVLKPVHPSRLGQAMVRAGALVERKRERARLPFLDPCQSQAPGQVEDAAGRRDAESIWAMRGADFVPLRVGDIERAEADRDYVHLHNGDRAYLLRSTLSALHERLGKNRYLRVRRSAIVRVDRILTVRDRGYGEIFIDLRSGAQIRVGRTYLKPLRERMRQRSEVRSF